jgi:hypothetical protein
MFEQMLKSYFKKIFEVGKTGDAREESYYSTLVDLLNTYAESINKKNIHITTLPKKTEAGNPDFRIWDGKQHIIGYIEAKAPTTEYLDQVCNKWLKDRKGRMLSLEDIRHYCKVVTAIKNTIEIQKEIDNLYPEIEKEIIEFKNLGNKK